jgi:hypothetical protein
MDDINQIEMIRAIEDLNREKISLINDSTTVENERKSRLLNEIKHFQVNKLISHIAVRLRPKISVAQSNCNMPKEKEYSLAKLGDPSLRVSVFTCITGKYDSPKPPYVHFPNCEYYIVSDGVSSNGWKQINIDKELIAKYGASLANRYVKFHPDEYFSKSHDYAVYLDGNITPVSDLSVLTELVDKDIGLAFHKHCSRNKLSEEYIACLNQHKGNLNRLKSQVEWFFKEGMPDDFGLIEGNFYVCDLKNPKAISLLHQCWDLLLKTEIGRDQIIWPYILWKNNIKLDSIATLGLNVWKNVKISIGQHN